MRKSSRDRRDVGRLRRLAVVSGPEGATALVVALLAVLWRALVLFLSGLVIVVDVDAGVGVAAPRSDPFNLREVRGVDDEAERGVDVRPTITVEALDGSRIVVLVFGCFGVNVDSPERLL